MNCVVNTSIAPRITDIARSYYTIKLIILDNPPIHNVLLTL